jgi:hypothetical protein
MRAERSAGGRGQPRRGEPLGEAARAALARFARLVPRESQAARLMGIGERTYVRALAGLGLQRGTRLLIETRIRELKVDEVER